MAQLLQLFKIPFVDVEVLQFLQSSGRGEIHIFYFLKGIQECGDTGVQDIQFFLAKLLKADLERLSSYIPDFPSPLYMLELARSLILLAVELSKAAFVVLPAPNRPCRHSGSNEQ